MAMRGLCTGRDGWSALRLAVNGQRAPACYFGERRHPFAFTRKRDPLQSVGTLLARGAERVATMDAGRRELAGAGLFARDGVVELVAEDGGLPKTADTVLDLHGQRTC
jgi:hypothetical protein